METTDLPKMGSRGPRPSVRLSRRSLALGFGWGGGMERGLGASSSSVWRDWDLGSCWGRFTPRARPPPRFSLHSPTPFPGVSALAAGTPGLPPSSPASESEATGRASGLGALRPGGPIGQGRAQGGGRARSGRPRGSRGPRPPRPAPGAASTSGCGRRAGRAPGRPRGRRQRRAETIAPRPQPAWRRKAAAAGRAGPGPHLGSRAGNAPPRRALGAEGPGGLSRPRTARFLT